MTAPTDARAFLRALFDTAVARAQPTETVTLTPPPAPSAPPAATSSPAAPARLATAC